ncbi:hypothetical protein PG999_014101 [Apiospora kogelbergensis]|uniref:Uncharacterized protein n=1 Tax=Apiospora kogelbergensis TaxID=1337665 RepID=A0AAW0QMJ0_9PEZI
MDANEQVYLGFWTNWSRGSAVMGSTLTLTREHGNFLIAFTALFIPFVASRFWRIFAIILHQYYSASSPRDTIYHQRQVLLCNSSSPETGLVAFIRLMWAWRRSASHLWSRILPVALFSLLSIGAFTVAGGFSSQISTTGEVLLKGSDCGIITALSTPNDLPSALGSRSAYWASTINSVANYAQQCYSNQSSSLLECSKFVTRTIPTSAIDYKAPCPFAAGSCRRNNSNIRLDTGHMHSGNMFGLNTREDQALTVRYVLQCAPLDTAGHTRNITLLDRNFTAYNYGPLNLLNTRNGVQFMSLADDDWYRATVPVGHLKTNIDVFQQDSYRPDEAVSPLGCVEQFQWCRDPDQGQCGSLGSPLDALYSAAPLFNLTTKELEPDRPLPQSKPAALFLWTYFTLFVTETALSAVVATLGPASLASTAFLSEGVMSGLQKNQWQLDVTRWWSIILAGLQAAFVRTAQGSTDPAIQNLIYKPGTDYEWDLCHSQKIRNGQYTSFSVFGLALTYSMGAVIIVTSFLIEPSLRCLQKRNRYNKYAYLEWEGSTAIQLHRVAHDQLGYGHWSRCNEKIPITQSEDLLAPFDISDPEHPLLAARTADDSPAEDAKPEPDSTIQGSSTEQDIPNTIRRARTDARAHVRRENDSPALDQDLESRQPRPSTAP